MIGEMSVLLILSRPERKMRRPRAGPPGIPLGVGDGS